MDATVQSPAGARKLRRDAQRNHDKIVAAASELYAERGVDVSLDDIARHAGVGVATAYRHFPDKAELIDAVFADVMDRIVDLAREAATQERAWDGLVMWLTKVAEIQAADAGLLALMKSRSRGGERASGAHDQMADAIIPLIRRARAEGDLRGDFELGDIGGVYYMLAGVIEATKDVKPDIWRRYFQVILDGMRASRDRPSKLRVPALTREQIERTRET